MTARDAGRRHVLGQIDVREYFDTDEDMAATLAAIQFKIVACFLRATHPETDRATGRDNYISGLTDRPGDLARYVGERINIRREFGHGHLPKRDVALGRDQWEVVLRNIHARLICLVIVLMRDAHNLWYMDGDWLFTNQLRIDHDHMAQVARRKDNDYHGDRRTFHGRPSIQGRRRARGLRVAPGVSIGGS